MHEYLEKQARYNALQQLLSKYDYWTSKHADGEYTPEEWAEKAELRKAWREEVRILEIELPALEQAYHEEQARLEHERWEAEQARLAEERARLEAEQARLAEQEGDAPWQM